MDSTSPFQPWASDESAKNVKSEGDVVDDAKLHRENVNHPKHRQTASYDKESTAVPSSTPGTSGTAGSGGGPPGDKESKMDSSKVASMQQIVENTLSQEGRQRVAQLLEAVESLSGAERLLLYLRLPTGVPPHDPLKQPINPLGSRAELQQTVIWIQTHLEVDPDVSLPKQDVYDEYIAHCMSSNMKPLSTADFGKVMKQVYPSVRPRRLGTRGNSRYCYAGLRKKIKLEVPQLPDLGESSKEPTTTSRESDRVICDWAETKLGVKFANVMELARHLATVGTAPAPAPAPPPGQPPPAPASLSPPPLAPTHTLAEEAANRQLIKHLKRKIQTQGTPGRPKKNKAQEMSGDPSASTSTYVGHHGALKQEHEGEGGAGAEPGVYGYPPPPPPGYVAMYEVRPPAPFPGYPAPRALPPLDYRPEPYAFESAAVYDPGPHLPINLSSDVSLDLRRRPPDPPPAAHAPHPPHPPHQPRLPLPGKKLILETYQSETRAAPPEPRPPPAHPAPPGPAPDDFPRTEYLPKKMRAAEILGGKLAAARLAAAAEAPPPPPHAPRASAPRPVRPEVAFLEDPKNFTSRSKSTAAALAREEQEAASPTRSTKAPTTAKGEGARERGASGPSRPDSPDRPPASPDSCCGLDGINIKTGMICEEKHSEILNRERVISICNIDKHDLDDYLNEGSSQEHEEEMLQYFPRGSHPPSASSAPRSDAGTGFLEAGSDPPDDHSQGKNEKISQLRELLAKNLKNQSGSNSQTVPVNQEVVLQDNSSELSKATITGGAFKPLAGIDENELTDVKVTNQPEIDSEHGNAPIENGTSLPYVNSTANPLIANVGNPHMYNGNCHNEPQSPTTRTQQYDFVPISDGCHSPGNFNSKSPLGFNARGQSPSKVSKQVIMGGSLQTSPISHSTAASPFVSPRNTPVPRSRFCSRPIPKHNGRKRRTHPLTLGCSKPFAVPNEQKFMKSPICGPGKYYQPMSAPPSPNILNSQFKNQMYPCAGIPNGANNLCLSFLPNAPFRDHMNGDQPLSADPLSSEVSQFFQDSVNYSRPSHDAFRSQSVPLKQGINNIGLLSYNNTPVGSVPPTPIPNEFCDFGSLAETCDITKAGLNRETLDKIYNAIDSSNDVLSDGTQTLLNSNEALSNGCDPLPDPQILSDEQLTSLIPTGDDLLDRSNQFNQTFNDTAPSDNVEDFLKRTNSIEFDLSELVTDKNKYYSSRSVPSTPLPFKRAVPNLQIDSRHSRELFAAENNYSNISNGISSKSVPSTPQFAEDRSVFSYSNRDFLINGNSVSGSSQIHETVVDSDQGLGSPLHDILREDILAEPLTPALLADFDKMDGAPYVDL